VAVGIALLPMPYGYYQAMRWVVAVACIALALHFHSVNTHGWQWIWLAMGGIYNPIVPIHATREFWLVLNLIAIGVASSCLLLTKRSS
jgi:hypothetical protein